MLCFDYRMRRQGVKLKSLCASVLVALGLVGAFGRAAAQAEARWEYVTTYLLC
jgi:hypothetical protein